MKISSSFGQTLNIQFEIGVACVPPTFLSIFDMLGALYTAKEANDPLVNSSLDENILVCS